MEKSNMHRRNGFSLIELLIAIAILSIIAAIGWVNLHSYTMNRNLKSAAGDIASDIALCKASAVADRSTAYTITFNKGSNNYTMTGKVTVVKTPAEFQAGIVIDDVALADGGTTITCQARGTLNPASGNIRLKNSRGTTATTYYSATGRTYVK